MNLTDKQKKFIIKNISKLTSDSIARTINKEQSQVLEFLEENKIDVLPRTQEQAEIIKKNKIKSGFIWWSFSFLAVLVLISYIGTLGHSFVSDDIYIMKNKETGNFSILWTQPQIFLATLHYYILYNLSGVNPWLYRLVNIFFHLGNVYLLYFITILLSGNLIGLIVASIFAVHPILIESVTWVTGGSYSRYTFFILLSLLFYILSLKNKKYYWWSIIVSIFALLSSEKAIIIPLLYFLYEIVFGNIKENWKKLSAYFAISGVWVLFYLSQIGNRISGLTTTSYNQTKLLNPLVQIPVAIATYLQLIFWPDKLTLYHSELTFTTLQFSLRVLGFLGVLGMLGWAWKKNKQIFFWLSFFVISLLPTLTPFGISWIVAERYVYLGSIGIFFITGYLLAGLIKNEKTKIIGYVLCVMCVGGLMIRTIVRNMDWKNEDTLWLSMKDISVSDPKTHNNLGDMYGRHGDLKKAEEEFKKAIEINPNYGDAYHNLANTYLQMKKYDLAIENYQKALKTNPNLWQSYQNIAAIYYEQKDFALASSYMEKAVAINNQDDNLFLNLALTYLQINKINEAKIALDKCLTLNPQNTKAKDMLLMINKK